MGDQDGVDSALKRALKYLAVSQGQDGSFVSYSSPNVKRFQPKQARQTVFGPAIILSALAEDNSPAALAVRRRLSRWLLAQKGPHWSFNYWAKDEPARKKLPYPDDLDDTFCALIGLHRHDPGLISGGALASVVKLLVATEASLGGPYRTWLVPADSPKQWLDIDLAVNANVACFLSAISNPLPNLDALMEQAIDTRQFVSPYYPSVYPVIYYLTRAYQGEKGGDLIEYVLGLRDSRGVWPGPLQTALMISALRRLGYNGDLSLATAYLLNRQGPNGAWAAEVFCLDPQQGGRKYYSGSPAITTALVVEALSLLKTSGEAEQIALPANKDEQADKILHAVVSAAQEELQKFGCDPGVLERLDVSGKGTDIVLLPYLFYKSLADKKVRLKDGLFINLGLANLYGWLAYTIYDDLMDGDGQPNLLPAANLALRRSLHYFYSVLPNSNKYKGWIDRAFDTIDGANQWELNHCRFLVQDNQLKLGVLPKWGYQEHLAERSLGHCLTPVAVLVATGEELDGPLVLDCFQAFKHYIIARQINDDLHDWQEDLLKGRNTYVITEVMNELKLKGDGQDLKHLVPVMQQQLWNLTLPKIYRTISGHTKAARKLLVAHPLLADNILTNLLDNIDTVNEQTLKKVSQAEDFLRSYRLS